MITRVAINWIDKPEGPPLASGGTFANEQHVWPWIVETICEQLECEETAIDQDEQDRITVHDVPTFTIQKDYRTGFGWVRLEAAE